MAYLTLFVVFVTISLIIGLGNDLMNIVVLATPKCTVSAVYGVVDVFFAANYCQSQRYGEGKKDSLNCQVVTITDQPVMGYNGFSIMPTQLVNAKIPDVIIVSSSVESIIDCCADHFRIDNQESVSTWLNNCKEQGSLIASYCTGSLVLAACGLLKNKIATTHWRSEDLFRRLFPHNKLDCSQLIVDNGDVICSGGSMSYIDLSLYIVNRLIGKEIASETAKLLVFDPVREKQSPYTSFSQLKDHNDQPILMAQEWLETHFKQQVLIDDLASYAGLSSRTFKRRFKNATTENPLNYLQRIRVEYVKDKLSKTTEAINKIIWSVGYEDIGSFRQLFKRFTGLTPTEYRQKFS